jgi:hypothetical protein
VSIDLRSRLSEASRVAAIMDTDSGIHKNGIGADGQLGRVLDAEMLASVVRLTRGRSSLRQFRPSAAATCWRTDDDEALSARDARDVVSFVAEIHPQ